MGRPSSVKVSDAKFKEIFLECVFTKDGVRRSYADIVKMPEFKRKTGLKNGKTTGTLDHHLDRLGITEQVIFDYAKEHDIIPIMTEFSEFSNNKKRKGSNVFKLVHGEDSKRADIKIYNKIAELLFLPFTATGMGVDAMIEYLMCVENFTMADIEELKKRAIDVPARRTRVTLDKDVRAKVVEHFNTPGNELVEDMQYLEQLKEIDADKELETW